MSFWFPRFNYNGSRVTHEDTNKYQAQFMGDKEIWHNGFNLVIDGKVQPGIKGYNVLAAGAGDKWAGFIPGIGIESNFGFSSPLGAVPAISPNGFFFSYVDNYQAGQKNLFISWEEGGNRVTVPLDFGAITDTRLSNNAAVWSKAGVTWGHWFGVTAGLIQVAPWEGLPVPIDTPEGVWVGCITQTGIIVRPFGSNMGYRFDNGGQCYFPDWVWDSAAQRIHCIFTNDKGNKDEQFFDLSQPRTNLSSVVIPPDVPMPQERPRVTISSFEPKSGPSPLKVKAIAELSGGPAKDLTWKLDGIAVVTNPASDLDHTYDIVSPGVHRINVRVDGPGGWDETGLIREVTVTGGTPPDPPDPPQPSNKKNIKVGDRYLYVDNGVVSIGNQKDVFELNDDSVSTHGKYVATLPNGVLEANRDSVGDWEFIRFNYVDNRVSIFSTFHKKYWRVDGNRVVGDTTTEFFFDLENVQFDTTVKINGEFFTREDGTPITIIQCSEFSLYKFFLDGQDINPILAERSAIGFNCLRVWLLNTSVIPGGLEPKNYSDFYSNLVLFTRLCASYGFIVEFTVFTQTKTLMPNITDQQIHLGSVCDALRGEKNIIIELVNENDQHDNECWSGLVTPSGLISSHGSNGADHRGVEPIWDYSQYHTNDLNEWQRKVGHNAMELAHEFRKPVVSNENMRFPDKDSSTIHAFDAAAGATLLCAGACFHSQSGKFSRPFDDVERRCAEEWVRGAKSVPLQFQHGQYIRRDDLLEPGVIRVYEKRLPNESYILRIRA